MMDRSRLQLPSSLWSIAIVDLRRQQKTLNQPNQEI